MKLFRKKIFICGILFSQVFCTQAWAGEEVNSICYQNTIDTENSNFDEGLWKYKFEASAGENVILEEGEKHTFLIINGSISSEDIVIKNARSYIELKGICRELDLPIKEANEHIIIENGSDIVVLEKKSLMMEKNKERLDMKGMVIGDEVYVPIRGFAALFNISVSYSRSNIMPMYNPLINIESRERSISKDQALQIAKKKMQEYYQLFESNNPNEDKDSYNSIQNMQIHEAINNIQYIDETASFWT